MPPSLFFGVISSRLHPLNPCFSLKSEHDKRSEKVPEKCLSNSPQKASKNPAPNLLLIRSGKQNKSFSISNLPNILWLYPIVNGG